MSDTVEQLRAQAVELREPISDIHGTEYQIPPHVSLADLIDGMLAEHKIDGHGPQFAGGNVYDADAWCETCGSAALDDGACPSLRLLAKHVTAVLSGCTQTAREAQ